MCDTESGVCRVKQLLYSYTSYTDNIFLNEPLSDMNFNENILFSKSNRMFHNERTCVMMLSICIL